MQRGVTIPLERLAGLLATEGKTDEALALYQESLGIGRRLLEVEPERVQRHTDVAVTLMAIAQVTERAEPLAEAHGILKPLSEADVLEPRYREIFESLERTLAEGSEAVAEVAGDQAQAADSANDNGERP